MNKKKIIMMSTLLVVLLVVIIGLTYAAYTYTGNSNLNTIDLGRISMSYTEPSNAYVLNNALPMSDEEGRGQNEYFEFTVTTHATTKESDSVGITIPYEINISDIIIDEGMNALSKSLIKVNLVKVDGMAENEVVVPTLISGLATSNLNTGASVVYQASDTHKNGSTTITSKYRLRAWITTGFDASNEETYQYKFRVNVNSNMDALEGNDSEASKLLRTAILDQGVVTTGDGLYMSTQTNDNSPTYYYHGNVENNYVNFGQKTACMYNGLDVSDFSTGSPLTEEECGAVTNLCDATSAVGVYLVGSDETSCTEAGGTYISDTATWETTDMKWKIVRINEDNSIRLIYAGLPVMGAFNPNTNEYKYMYYSESNVDGGIMKALNDWYSANLTDYDSEIATSTFCEQAKVKPLSDATSGNAEMTVYTEYEPDFKCAKDGNGYGLITDQKVGLITIDELLHAGGVIDEQTQFYLSNAMTWTMSPAGFLDGYASAWSGNIGYVDDNIVYSNPGGLPVISLKADTLVTGNGTSTSPWVVTK